MAGVMAVSANDNFEYGSSFVIEMAKDLRAGDIAITKGNPFFNEAGDPYFDYPTKEMVVNLTNYGCKWAWRRQQHEADIVTETCNELTAEFRKSGPGTPLGLLSVIFAEGIFSDEDGVYSVHEDVPIITHIDLLQQNDDGFATANLSSLGWGLSTPPILQPVTGYSIPQLQVLSDRGGNGIPYAPHTTGDWAFEVALSYVDSNSELSSNTTAGAFLAAKWACELWLRLGHHFWQGDRSLDILCLGGNCTDPDSFMNEWGKALLIHGVHAGTWSIVRHQMDLGFYQKPTVEMWSVVNYLCNGTKELDYALFSSCAHGLGHTLSWFVSNQYSTIAEAVAVCSEQVPVLDRRSLQECHNGIYHELERGGVWRARELGQHFMPTGVAAPCDHEEATTISSSMFACFGNLAATGKAVFPNHRIAPTSWFEVEEVKDVRAMRLTAEGALGWRDTIAFCSAAPYPGYTADHTAGCVAAFHDWIGTSLQFIVADLQEAGDTNLTTLVRYYDDPHVPTYEGLPPLTNPTAGVHPGSAEMPAVPRLKAPFDGSWSSVGALFDISTVDLALCEKASVDLGFWVYAWCTHTSSLVWADHAVDAIVEEGPVYTQKLDPYGLFHDGTEETESAMACHARWNRTNFEMGTERQLAYMEWLCVNSALTKEWSYSPTLDWIGTPSTYFSSDVSALLKDEEAYTRPRGEGDVIGLSRGSPHIARSAPHLAPFDDKYRRERVIKGTQQGVLSVPNVG